MDSSSFLGSSKRAKAPANITQVAHCLVDGCDADLSLCRDYHRRHKVCEAHSKTPKVTIGGREQRFCQQCSRFHSLVEFDEGKRSCRKRLDGHNRRRRKPQPESLSRNPGLVFSSQPGVAGGRLLSFSSPQILPSAALSSSWAGVVKSENDIMLYNTQQQMNYMERQNSFPEQSFRVVNQLEFLQSSERVVCCQPLLDPHAANPSLNSDRALSLLSPTPREFGLNHVAVEPVVHGLHYCCTEYPYGEGSKAAAGADFGTDSRGSASDSSMFQHHHASEGSSTPGSHQTLTFTWE